MKQLKMFVVVDYVKGMTVKSCKYGEYGSFEHLFFLFRTCIVIVYEHLKLKA